MEVILKQDIQNLGNKDDIVTVRNGYGANWLIPQGLAIMATPTAKKMAEGCARGAKRSMLLGGAKNMLVVMEDADIDAFIPQFLNSCFGSAGQRCLAGSIVAIVPELYEKVLDRMIEAAKTVKVGDALDPDVYMGPLISRKAADKVIEYVDIALKHGRGCKLVLDGRHLPVIIRVPGTCPFTHGDKVALLADLSKAVYFTR